MEYGEQANGTEISVHIGEEFEVALAETRTAGYRWTISENGEPTLQLVEEVGLPNVGSVGGAGQRQWHFRGASTGETEINMRYARSWEKSSEPARTFTLRVHVRS